MFSDELQRQLELPAVIKILQGAAMTVEGESQLGIPSFLHTPGGIGAEQLLVGQCRRVLQTNQKGSPWGGAHAGISVPEHRLSAGR